MPNTRLPYQVRDFTGDIQVRSGYVVSLREYPFTVDTIIGTEAVDALGYYDFVDVQINTAYQQWAGTSIQTMSRNFSFSDDDGKVLWGIDDSALIDAAQYTNGQVPVKNDLLGGFEPGDLPIPESGVDYLFFRASLIQKTGIDSGKMFAGGMGVDTLTGDFFQVVGSVELTIADSFNRSMSSRLGVGVYKLQFRTSAANQFITGVNGTGNRFKFKSFQMPVYGGLTSIENPPGSGQFERVISDTFKGYIVLDVDYSHLTYYDTGVLIIRTFDPTWTPADDVVGRGITVEFPFYSNLT